MANYSISEISSVDNGLTLENSLSSMDIEQLVGKLHQIDCANNLAYWSELQYQNLLSSGYRVWVLINDNDELSIDAIVGFCLLQQVLDEAEILNVVIDRAHQNKGLAKRLLQEVINDCSHLQHSQTNTLYHQIVRYIFLDVRADNIAALSVYQSLGFEQTGFRANYYRPTVSDNKANSRDAILMTKHLSST